MKPKKAAKPPIHDGRAAIADKRWLLAFLVPDDFMSDPLHDEAKKTADELIVRLCSARRELDDPTTRHAAETWIRQLFAVQEAAVDAVTAVKRVKYLANADPIVDEHGYPMHGVPLGGRLGVAEHEVKTKDGAIKSLHDPLDLRLSMALAYLKLHFPKARVSLAVLHAAMWPVRAVRDEEDATARARHALAKALGYHGTVKSFHAQLFKRARRK